MCIIDSFHNKKKKISGHFLIQFIDRTLVLQLPFSVWLVRRGLFCCCSFV